MSDYRRLRTGVLRIRPEVEVSLQRWRQLRPRSREAGGVLLGTWQEFGQHVVVSSLTEPMPSDRRTLRGFWRSQAPHQAAIDWAWRDSDHTQTWLGEWHTHPEDDPSPSAIDRQDWRSHMNEDTADGDALFFVIVGRVHTRVWEARRPWGSGTRLRVLG